MTIKRQAIVDAIEDRMQLILTTSNYYSNVGNSVIVGRPQTVSADGIIGSAPVDSSELPCVLIRDPLDEITNSTLGGKQEHRLSIELELRAEGGAATATSMRQMVSDVYKAIGTDTTWSGLALNTLPVSDETVLLQGDRIIGAVLIRMSINYMTGAWSEE